MTVSVAESQHRVKKVLVVDDDAQIRRSLAAFVERSWGACPYCASDLATATVLARRHEPEVAFVDYQLPDGNGIDVIRQMREANRSAILVLMTGFGTIPVAVAAMKAGATEVLTKPFTAAELRSCVPSAQSATRGTAFEVPTASCAKWELVRRVVREVGGNKCVAARKLGMSRNTLKRWLRMPRPRR